MPVFGSEMLIADRRLIDRFKKMRAFVNTLRGAITVIAVAGFAIYTLMGLIAYNVLDANAVVNFVAVLGLGIIPLYSSFNALAVGALTFSDPLDRGIASDWIVAGVSPKKLAKELLLFRIVKYIPQTIVYSAVLFFGLCCMLSYDQYWRLNTVWPVISIFVAFVLIQGMFISGATLVATFARTLAGRFFAVFGYFILHNALPFVLLFIFEEYMLHSGPNKAVEYAFFAAQPYGLFVSSIMQLENAGLDAGLDYEPFAFFAVSFIVQVLTIWLFTVFAIRRFTRIVMS